MRQGTANLPLHGGHAPRWLFERMVTISAEVASWIVAEHGTPGRVHEDASVVGSPMQQAFNHAMQCRLGGARSHDGAHPAHGHRP